MADIAAADARESLPARIVGFYHNVVAEMRRVTWPDREQVKDSTIKLIIFVLVVGAVISLIDLVLQGVLVQGIPALFTGR
jgi:preprotein translocase subunit SecE